MDCTTLIFLPSIYNVGQFSKGKIFIYIYSCLEKGAVSKMCTRLRLLQQTENKIALFVDHPKRKKERKERKKGNSESSGNNS